MKPVRLGMLVPSSNTVIEPVTSAIVAGLPEVSVHFARFWLTEIPREQASRGHFDPDLDAKLLEAARLLAHARVDVIAWNGSAAGWRGFDVDERLCARITAETGVPATSSVLALNEVFRTTGVREFGLVNPGPGELQERIIANYARAGLRCVAERHLDLVMNHEFAEVSPPQIETMVRDVAAARPQAITTFCTNFRGAPLVDGLERERGIPIFDTVAVAVWKSLKLAGVNPGRVRGWGRLFAV